MNLPNTLTVSRIFLTLGFIFFLLQSGWAAIAAAIVLFTLASLTDFYDGYLAKKHNLVSTFGKIMDPIADKFLMLAAFYLFVGRDLVPMWMFGLIFAREVAVTASRFAAMRKGTVLAADRSGKAKTVTQIVAVSLILIYLLLQEAGASAAAHAGWFWGIYVVMLATVGITLFSGAAYFWNNREVLS